MFAYDLNNDMHVSPAWLGFMPNALVRHATVTFDRVTGEVRRLASRVAPPQQDAYMNWSADQYAAFARELDALLADVTRRLGDDDVDYVHRVRRLSRLLEAVGRLLIHVSVEPTAWLAGVCALWTHHQLEAVEIGHSALHGAWDGFDDAAAFHSDTFQWDTPVDETAWRREHNVLHHQYTNIVGRDPDLSYGPLRVAEQTTWRPYHLVQVAQLAWTAPVFFWMIALHAAGLTDLAHPPGDPTYAPVLRERSPRAILGAAGTALRKATAYAAYEFVLWPVLAGPFWWKVFAGNVLADVGRSVYSCATIYAGHFGDDVAYPPLDFQPRGRGAWYRMQVQAAHDFAVPHVVSVLCGALDHQIEHHLFPKLPPNRLREIAPAVAAICARHGVRYRRSTWAANLAAGVCRLARMSVPPALTPTARAA